MINFPTSTLTDIGTFSQTVITDFWPFILVAVGLPVGFWLIKKGISLLPGDFRTHDERVSQYNLRVKELAENIEAGEIDAKVLRQSRLNYEAGKLSQSDYEKILNKYSK